jgi:predicted RNA-binding protein associated with RNAse of E/G family
MVTVVKLNTAGETKIQYEGEIVRHLEHGVVIQAYWKRGTTDLGYVRFEPGDSFTEYYYSDRWYNIFDIADATGQRKGWYCNIAQPASIFDGRIEQVDLLLDVWVDPRGKPLVLDEDEFAADQMMSAEVRQGALDALHELLEVIAAQREPFAYASSSGKERA